MGAKCVTTRRIGGASRPSTSELVHIDPPRTWGVRGTDGPIRAAVDVLVEPVTGSRSRLTISVDFTGHGIGKILVPLMVRREARKEMPANMAALKQQDRSGLTRQHLFSPLFFFLFPPPIFPLADWPVQRAG